MHTRWMLTPVCALVLGCVGDPASSDAGGLGTADATCYANGTCNAGLTCNASSVCKPSDAGAVDAGAADSGASDAPQDSAPPVVNGCTTFTDDRAVQAPTISGPNGVSPAQYTPNCVHIKAGQTIVFTGDFSAHPLQPSGGSNGNPIAPVNTGSVATFSFSTSGVYGFDCTNHPTIMFGAIEVTTN